MAKINISNHKVNYTDEYFFDTNVWLLLFGTVADFQLKYQKSYSEFLSDLIQKDKPIYITTLIISEISNVLLRIDFNEWKDKNRFFNKEFKKDFVGTEDYRNSVSTISLIINKILSIPNVIRIPDDFHLLDLKSTLEDMKKIDFNDSVYTAICSARGFKIISNDSDFFEVSHKIDIISALA